MGGLYPGTYFVAVVATQVSPSNNAPFFRTYLPGTHNVRNAMVTTVAAGQTVDLGTSNMPSRDQFTTAQITVLDSNGAVVAGAPLFAFPAGDSSERPRRAATTGADGRAEVSGLLPGKYSFTAEVQPRLENGGRGIYPTVDEPSLSPRWGIVEVEPTAGVTTAAVMVIEPVSRLSGQLIARDSGAESLTVELKGVACRQCRLSVRAQSDGSFTVERLPPGEYDLKITTREGTVVSVEALVSEGAEQVQPSGDVRITAGRAITLMLATAKQGIEGHVKDANGKPFIGSRIVAVPIANDRDRSSQMRPTRSDTKGRYRIVGLPSGVYVLVAAESRELDSLAKVPLDEIRQRGVVVKVERGRMAVQDLKILGQGRGLAAIGTLLQLPGYARPTGSHFMRALGSPEAVMAITPGGLLKAVEWPSKSRKSN